MRHLDGRASRARRCSTGDYRTERPVRYSAIYRAAHRSYARDHESERDQSEYRHDQSQRNQWEHERAESERDAQ